MEPKISGRENSHIPFLVVMFLGIIALVLSVGILILADKGRPADAALYTLAGSAIGALGALLTNATRGGQRADDNPQPVTIDGQKEVVVTKEANDENTV